MSDLNNFKPVKIYNELLQRTEYKLSDTFHRDPKDGPALEYDDGSQVFIQDGLLHNPYGPAIVWKRNEPFVLTIRGYPFEADSCIKDTIKCTKIIFSRKEGKYGNKGLYWYLCGKRHRDPRDGPAIELDSGYKEYYVCGYLHNDFGPAIIDGENVSYFQYGKLHNFNGPAQIRDNKKEYYLYANNIDSLSERPVSVGEIIN